MYCICACDSNNNNNPYEIIPGAITSEINHQFLLNVMSNNMMFGHRPTLRPPGHWNAAARMPPPLNAREKRLRPSPPGVCFTSRILQLRKIHVQSLCFSLKKSDHFSLFQRVSNVAAMSLLDDNEIMDDKWCSWTSIYWTPHLSTQQHAVRETSVRWALALQEGPLGDPGGTMHIMW